MAAVEAEVGEEEAGEVVVVVEAESQTGEARMTWTLNLVGIARSRDHKPETDPILCSCRGFHEGTKLVGASREHSRASEGRCRGCPNGVAVPFSSSTNHAYFLTMHHAPFSSMLVSRYCSQNVCHWSMLQYI